ncbi:MAG: hypothetical protein KJ645_00495 [Planctomycetes bacterium]|nr:hypothetical protein [Planctomycetota bacterium]
MKWNLSFRKRDPERALATKVRLEQIRLRKILENTRNLLDLLDDGRDKAGGGYILDRHYVETLLDTMIEKAGLIIYDACMLVPDGGAGLYDQFDRIKNHGRKMLLTEDGVPYGDSPGAGAYDDLDPEYQLLSRALEWIDGPRRETKETLIGFMREALDHVILGWNLTPDTFETLARNFGGGGNIIHLLDTDRYLGHPTGDSGVSLLNFFFGELAGREGSESEGTPGEQEKRWLAVSGGQHLSVRRIHDQAAIRIEACLSSIPNQDILFVYADEGIFPGPLMASLGFRVEKSKRSTMAWLYGVRPERIEDSLTRLGHHVNGGSA